MPNLYEITMINNPTAICLVDQETFEWAGKLSWHLDKFGYAQRSFRREPGSARWTKKFMHRLIMGDPKGLVIDHLNFNRLDNRKSNLRICTAAENNLRMRPKNQRTVFPRGPVMPILTPEERAQKIAKVCVRPSRDTLGRWFSRFSVQGKDYHVGTFDSFDEALRAGILMRAFYDPQSQQEGA